MTAAAGFGGWLAAGLAGAMALAAWRALGSRMERVAGACHELRGPITAARLGLELESRTGERSAARLRAIDGELDRAALALNDLAGVRDGRTAGRDLVWIELDALLADSTEALRAQAAAAGAELQRSRLGGDPRLLGDRVRLAQAIGNLVSNAIEHGGSRIDVRGSVGGFVARVEVLDDGPGLPAPLADLTRRARRGRGRHGRGLAIVAEIAAAHGGRLSAVPAARGARLVLELPAGGAAAGERRLRELV